MSFTIILALIIFIIYLIGYFGYVLIIYNKKVRTIWFVFFNALLLFLILTITSSFFEINISYFQDLWLWFSILGICLLAGGIRIMQIAHRARKSIKNDKIPFQTAGIFKVMRHPHYLAFFLIYYGLAILLDSVIGILLIPVLMILLVIIVTLEEKKVLLSNFKESYKAYLSKTPFKMFPNPYNYFLIIVTVLIFYVGFLNLSS